MSSRPIHDVARAILNQVPPDFPAYGILERSFDGVLNSAYYTAPEAMYIRWDELSALLHGSLKDHTHLDWVERIRRIFNNELNYEEFL